MSHTQYYPDDCKKLVHRDFCAHCLENEHSLTPVRTLVISCSLTTPDSGHCLKPWHKEVIIRAFQAPLASVSNGLRNRVTCRAIYTGNDSLSANIILHT